MKIGIGSDHGGFELKETLKKALVSANADVTDFGCSSKISVDYPDYASEVAGRVSAGTLDEGILVCTTGIGMVITANKFPRVRAALCLSPEMAVMARSHNNANILVMGESYVDREKGLAILAAWQSTKFSYEDRHARRVAKIGTSARDAAEYGDVSRVDPDLYAALKAEDVQEQEKINLIASENYVSQAVRQAQGSHMTNKYAEGYPRKRWYNGCKPVDRAEQLALDRAKELFGAEHANVQPHCGSSANMAVYFAMLQPGDTILAMSLAHGGHLTHGHDVNFSGRFFNVVSYGVSDETEQIDMAQVERLANEHKPKMIVVGASAYSRILEFDKFRAIADQIGAMMMVDMAHIAGLVAGGSHPSPVPYADFITSTTHKTLRGPRGGMILCREQYGKDIDRQVFPGLQGGPLMHVIAAKAVCFLEALQPEFKEYSEQIVKNASVMAGVLQSRGFRLVSGGTDNHLMLVDLSANGVTGRDAANALEKAGMVANKNTIPFEKKSPFVTSGVRLGTPAVTTRGMKEADVEELSGLIADVLDDVENPAIEERTARQIAELAARFPVIW